jgi:hypothetical protein
MSYPPWTAEEDQYLADHYLTDDIDNIANELNRTLHAIKNRVGAMPELYKRKTYRRTKIVACTKYKEALPADRWCDAEDFINMMARFKNRLTQDKLSVGKDRLFKGLPDAFNRYRFDMGR